jgi:hypothetical protein
MLFTLSAAARFLGIDRRTVQRYVQRFPDIVDGKMVEMILLQRRIDQFKARDARGFPLRKKRGKRLPLPGVPKKPPAVFRHTLSQWLEIIGRQINAMTDEEQQKLFWLWPGTHAWFREENVWEVLRENKQGQNLAASARKMSSGPGG